MLDMVEKKGLGLNVELENAEKGGIDSKGMDSAERAWLLHKEPNSCYWGEGEGVCKGVAGGGSRSALYLL